MRISKSLIIVAAIAAALVAIPALSMAAGTTQLTAKLRGSEEVPGPGDPNGKGEASVAVKPKREKVCFQLTFEKIEGATAAHIHKGVAGVAGPIKVELFEDATGSPGPTAEGCVKDQKKRLLRKIARKPQRFYVNVHNDDFPGGAIRGQLEPAR